MRTFVFIFIALVLLSTSSCKKEINIEINPLLREIHTAKNSSGTGTQYGALQDIDGNTYKTIKIGTQTWMAENLRVTRFKNGDLISNVVDASAWSTLTNPAWCYYSNNPKYNSVYGKLYNSYAALDSRGLAPEGWHIPTQYDWETLFTHLNGTSVAGGKMKSTGNKYWKSPNTGATNESGFSGLPGGYRANYGDFSQLSEEGWWGFINIGATPEVGFRVLLHSSIVLGDKYSVPYYNYLNANSGISFRCVKD